MTDWDKAFERAERRERRKERLCWICLYAVLAIAGAATGYLWMLIVQALQKYING